MDNIRVLLAVPVLFALTCSSHAAHVRSSNSWRPAGTVRTRRLHTTPELGAAVNSVTATAGSEDSIIPNRYIIALEDASGDAAAAAAALVQEVRTALRMAGAAAGEAAPAAAAATAGNAVNAEASATATDDSSDAAAAAAAAADANATGVAAVAADAAPAQPQPGAEGPTTPTTEDGADIAVIKVGRSAATAAGLGAATAAKGDSAPTATVVLRASAAAIQKVRSSPRVKAVIQDRYVRAQARALAQDAASCVPPSAMNSGVSTLPADIRPALEKAFTNLGCNVKPAKYVWRGSLCRGSASNINFTEVVAVHRSTNAPLQTSRGTPCRLARGRNARVNIQRFGNCGAAPALAKSLPTRVCRATGGGGGAGSGLGNTPSDAALPKVPVQPLEQVPSGVEMIGAASTAGVANMKAGRTVVVAVVDSGVDATHPDLNYLGGKAYVVPSTAVPDDSADPGVDLYGHGTHVAGIVGAKNDNSGVVGVAPGVGIYSLKVLDAQGVGSASDVMDAVSWAAGPEGKAAGIGVINLSLALGIEPTSEGYQDTFDFVCETFQRASNAGLVVVAAAGNYGKDVRGYLPAACPAVVAVTSVDPESRTVSSFSNFLSEPSTAAEKSSIMAAPGNAIKSTISYAHDASGYRELSGTSMASPHIAGVAAACIASGACAEATGVANLALLQAAAQGHLGAQPQYGFPGDTRSTKSDRFYGNLVWAEW